MTWRSNCFCCRYPAAIAGFVGGVWAAALDPNAKVYRIDWGDLSCVCDLLYDACLVRSAGFAEAFHDEHHELGGVTLAAAVN